MLTGSGFLDAVARDLTCHHLRYPSREQDLTGNTKDARITGREGKYNVLEQTGHTRPESQVKGVSDFHAEKSGRQIPNAFTNAITYKAR